jgi:hypothetical protein
MYQIGFTTPERRKKENLNHRHCDKQKLGDKHSRENISRVLF